MPREGPEPNIRRRCGNGISGAVACRSRKSGTRRVESSWIGSTKGQLQKMALLGKTCATYYDEHVPESAIEILGHSVGGITYRHYAHRAPLAFKAIMTLPQPSLLLWLSSEAMTASVPAADDHSLRHARCGRCDRSTSGAFHRFLGRIVPIATTTSHPASDNRYHRQRPHAPDVPSL